MTETFGKSLAFVRFPPNNKYLFYQDHNFWTGVPDDVNLYPESEMKNCIVFIGDKHGVMNRHKEKGIVGEYGNESITV